MSNEQQAQILLFPYQLAYQEELEGCYDAEIMTFQLRLWATNYLNAIYHGQMQPTPEVIERLTSMNDSLKAFGKPTLPLDF